jgi:hypothetical protein
VSRDGLPPVHGQAEHDALVWCRLPRSHDVVPFLRVPWPGANRRRPPGRRIALVDEPHVRVAVPEDRDVRISVSQMHEGVPFLVALRPIRLHHELDGPLVRPEPRTAWHPDMPQFTAEEALALVPIRPLRRTNHLRPRRQPQVRAIEIQLHLGKSHLATGNQQRSSQTRQAHDNPPYMRNPLIWSHDGR